MAAPTEIADLVNRFEMHYEKYKSPHVTKRTMDRKNEKTAQLRGSAMKRKSKRKDEAVAYHEAGHAVTNFELGRKIRKVTIIPTEDYSGACFDYKLLDSMADTYGDTPTVRRRVEREIMGKFAGQLAEDRFRGKSSKRLESD